MACTRPTARGPLLLSFLLDRTSEQTCAQQVDAFSAELGSVLTKMGKSDAATFSVVGVDSNTSKIVVEVVIDSCDGQNSRTIFDSIETLEPFSESAVEVVAAKDFKTVETAAPVDEKDAATATEEIATPLRTEEEQALQTAVEAAKPSINEVDTKTTVASLRSQFQGAKNLSMILNGACHHLLCLEAKKAVAAAAEKRAIAEVNARELEVFLQSKELEDARRGINEHQINFCNSEKHLVAAEMSGNKEAKRLWEQHITQVANLLASSTESFEALEDKRLAMTLDAVKSETAAQFAQVTAETTYNTAMAYGMQRELEACFTSYIAMEDYYAAQLEFQQPFFAPMQAVVVGAMPAAPSMAQPTYESLYYGAQTPQGGRPQIYVAPDLGSWRPVNTFCQPSAPTTIMMTSSVITDTRQVSGSAKVTHVDSKKGQSISIPVSSPCTPVA
jgi:hypothetical protein